MAEPIDINDLLGGDPEPDTGGGGGGGYDPRVIIDPRTGQPIYLVIPGPRDALGGEGKPQYIQLPALPRGSTAQGPRPETVEAQQIQNALARLRLQQAGVAELHGNDGTPAWCTVTQASVFFSHRRDAARLGSTGRMAACIWFG